MTNTPGLPEPTPSRSAERRPADALGASDGSGSGAAEPSAGSDAGSAMPGAAGVPDDGASSGPVELGDVAGARSAVQPGAEAGSGDGSGRGSGAVRDDGTFSRILEPRGSGRLPLGDGTWHQLARAYVWVQLISLGALFVAVAAVAVVLQVLLHVGWQWLPAAIVLLVTAIALIITPRQARSFGYQLRRDDLVFRRGILWQRVVAVPYGRMQLVDITHGPLDRGFGIAQLKLVTAAASTGVVIPGLTQAAAEQVRDTLIEVAESRRTGL